MSNTKRCWIGIDPGVSGAMAWIIEGQKAQVIDYDPIACCEALRAMVKKHECFAVIEEVVVTRCKREGRTSAFRYHTNWATWKGWLEMAGIPFARLRPAQWGKGIITRKGEERKEQAREVAANLYPEVRESLQRKSDHNRAESIIMAHRAKILDMTGEDESEVDVPC